MAAAVDPPENPQPEGSTSALSATGEDALRVSDADRNEVVELLGEHASAGRLTLAELEERTGRAYAARTRAELAELTRDLPLASTPARRGTARRWLLAIMGGASRRGRMRLSGKVNVVAVMGGDEIDLREAEIEGDELTVNVFALMGGSSIYVPDSVELELVGTAIMGGSNERGSSRQPRPGAPLIRVRFLAIMGGVEVWRLPAESRGKSLKEARRAAKELES